MNQILMVENKKMNNKKFKGSSAPTEIKKIIRFFAVAIIVFATFMISHSSYALYVDSKGKNTSNLAKVNIIRKNDTLIVDVGSEYTIKKFKYNWKNSEQTSITEESKSFQEEIILPSGNNLLTIVLEDETGRAVTYSKEIILDGVDINKPKIEINQAQGASIRISAIDETKIEYMTYKIDDGTEKRIDKNNENDKTIEYIVNEIPRGEHTIYVKAIDSAGNIEEMEAPVIVSSERPTIKNIRVDQETSKIIIEATDADGIASIEVNLNGAVYKMNDVNRKEAVFSLDVKQGKNTISIKLTNVNGLTAEGATEFEYAG